MPAKSTVNEYLKNQSEKDEPHLKPGELDSNGFMQQFIKLDKSQQEYLESILKVGKEDPQAFINGTMYFNGYKKNRKKDWYIPEDIDFKANTKDIKEEDMDSTDDADQKYKDSYKRPFESKRDAQPSNIDMNANRDSRTPLNFGFLGNLVYKASYNLAYSTANVSLAIHDGIKDGNQAAQQKREQSKKIEPVPQIKKADDEMKTNMKNYISSIMKKYQEDKIKAENILKNNEKNMSNIVSNTLGFDGLNSKFDADKMDNDKLFTKITKQRTPKIPKIDDITKKADYLTKEIKAFKENPAQYKKDLENSVNPVFSVSDEEKMDNKDELNFTIAKGTYDSLDDENNRLLSAEEYRNLDMKNEQDANSPYTLAFSDGIAKEYSNLSELKEDLSKNTPEKIHEENKKDIEMKDIELDYQDIENKQNSHHINTSDSEESVELDTKPKEIKKAPGHKLEEWQKQQNEDERQKKQERKNNIKL